MDTSRLLFLVFVVITPSECSEPADPKCEDLDPETYRVPEGEAFYFVPDELDRDISDERVTWYKNEIENITTDEDKSVHYHRGALFFLNLVTEDSGSYTTREIEPSGKCYNHHLKLDVLKASPTTNTELLYGQIKNSGLNKRVPCPRPVSRMCEHLGGSFNWKKDSVPLKGRHKADLRIENSNKDDMGIYTCICTWTHNNKEYSSSASRWLKYEGLSVDRKVQIISPTNKEQFAEEGVGIKLNCSVFCGTNVKVRCDARWKINGTTKYDQTTETVVLNATQSTFSTAILTIDKVSAMDFKTEFECVGDGGYTAASTTLTLKRRASIIPLVIRGVCVLFFCVFAAVLVKCFAIDLALIFRPYFPLSRYNKDGRVYDAYVVYQTQSMDKVTEDKLCQFVTNTLPAVLEEKCGYRLFIHGRDDIPGEDRLELVEDRMKQSRRLMVILTPGSGAESETTDEHPASVQNSVIGEFDWQVGLHHALLQREMSVILVQLGDTGPHGYKHLPAGLQHLIHKSAPIRWPQGSRGAASSNSRFWKRVRYLMPATPARKYPQSAII
ncbi:interleukin-1 receptor-like 1 [Sebastes fasciatus]|uniref:interleukin-1 receptor-like 1 n=1 Tax=Sebastes fasciatus TaxID=394691 RepID=UPI003D9DE6D0